MGQFLCIKRQKPSRAGREPLRRCSRLRKPLFPRSSGRNHPPRRAMPRFDEQNDEITPDLTWWGIRGHSDLHRPRKKRGFIYQYRFRMSGRTLTALRADGGVRPGGSSRAAKGNSGRRGGRIAQSGGLLDRCRDGARLRDGSYHRGSLDPGALGPCRRGVGHVGH